jgi:hypothetical protein
MRRMWIAVPLAGVLLAQTQPAKVTLEDLVAGEAGGRDGGRGLLLTADGRYFTGARGDQIQTYRITNGPLGSAKTIALRSRRRQHYLRI